MWWVELATLNDGALVAGAIAQALGLRARDKQAVREAVVALLRNQTALLVLDNCEHLLDAAAECVRIPCPGDEPGAMRLAVVNALSRCATKKGRDCRNAGTTRVYTNT